MYLQSNSSSSIPIVQRLMRRLREWMDDAVRDGDMMVAMSLDIANAFNFLPWLAIHSALSDKGVPDYIRWVIIDYLFDKYLIYISRDDTFVRSLIYVRRFARFGFRADFVEHSYDSILRLGLFLPVLRFLSHKGSFFWGGPIVCQAVLVGARRGFQIESVFR